MECRSVSRLIVKKYMVSHGDSGPFSMENPVSWIRSWMTKISVYDFKCVVSVENIDTLIPNSTLRWSRLVTKSCYVIDLSLSQSWEPASCFTYLTDHKILNFLNTMNFSVASDFQPSNQGPIHTKRKRERESERSKNKRKRSKNKRKTSKQIFAFAFAFARSELSLKRKQNNLVTELRFQSEKPVLKRKSIERDARLAPLFLGNLGNPESATEIDN